MLLPVKALQDWAIADGTAAGTGANQSYESFSHGVEAPNLLVDLRDLRFGSPSNVRAASARAKAQTETDNAKRAALYKQVSKLVQTDVARIPMFHANPLSAASKKVSGLVWHPVGGKAFTDVKLAK